MEFIPQAREGVKHQSYKVSPSYREQKLREGGYKEGGGGLRKVGRGIHKSCSASVDHAPHCTLRLKLWERGW